MKNWGRTRLVNHPVYVPMTRTVIIRAMYKVSMIGRKIGQIERETSGGEGEHFLHSL